MDIILASSSPYRKELLNKLGIPFTCQKPHVNEDSLTAELLSQNATAEQVAEALSRAKAAQVAAEAPSALIIAGDQLLSFEGRIFNKPLTHETATNQLSQLNGKEHLLITAITLLTPKKSWHLNHITRLKMKTLSQQEIQDYLKQDQPYDCAGSYKIESHGLILFERIDCDDFSAIQGIPMIWLSNRLKEAGYEFFKRST